LSAQDQRPRTGESSDPVRDRIATAIIGLAGTHGYEATSVEAVCGRAEVPSNEFESRFDGKEECYLDAYDEIAAEFGERVVAAYGAHTSWHDKVWAAGWAAIEFFEEDPVRARFYLVEINRAGDAAISRRNLNMQIFADLIDAGRAELVDPNALTRATAEIVAGAIYSTLQNKVLTGAIERGEDFIVELVYLAMLPYLGLEAAEAELRVYSLRLAR
jgi:AcrR family transcriptional regulator